MKTRLSRRKLQKSKKNIIITIIGIIVIIYLLFKLGIPILANFSLFISQLGRSDETSNIKEQTYVAQPILDPLPNATNSAIIFISGKAFKDQSIILYINKNQVSSQIVNDKGEYLFKEELNKGINEIKTKAKQGNNESDFSEIFNVLFDNEPPELEINSPSDGQSFSKGDNKIKVTGKTETSANVTINKFWAITDDANSFTYTLSLKDGDNTITVTAIDEAGNKTEKIIKVNYSP